MNPELFWYYLVALAVGALGAIHMPLSGALGVQIRSTSVAVFILFGVAFALSSVVVLLSGEREAFRALKSVPPWYFLAGVVSVLAVSSNTFLIPRLGAITMFVLVIFAQMAVRMVISHFGWFDTTISPISTLKVVGAIMLLVGAVLVVKN